MSSRTDVELEAAVHAALSPTWAEIVRAKHALRAILADGEPHGVRTLQSCLLTAAGIPVDADSQERLQMSTADDIARVATPDHPLLARHRLVLAATEALIDLAAQGLVVEVANAPDHATGNPLVGPGDITIGYQLANLGAGIRHATALAQLPAAYRLTPRHLNDGTAWFLDPDLFTADLRGLELDWRTRRCVTEALDAYRHGQFLACANLLGAASEGAWYAVGERLRHLDPQLARALDSDSTRKVMDRVDEVLRQHTPLRPAVPEIRAQAALLLQLRNYGIHPRPDIDDHLERYFTDASAAILLMETHAYLSRLAAAVRTRLDASHAASGN